MHCMFGPIFFYELGGKLSNSQIRGSSLKIHFTVECGNDKDERKSENETR